MRVAVISRYDGVRALLTEVLAAEGAQVVGQATGTGSRLPDAVDVIVATEAVTGAGITPLLHAARVPVVVVSWHPPDERADLRRAAAVLSPGQVAGGLLAACRRAAPGRPPSSARG